MATNTLGRCCITGVKHEGDPEGEWGNIAGVDTYSAFPPGRATENAILYLTDGFGCRFPNNNLLADALAANGYFVVMPDLFDDDPVPADLPSEFNAVEWMSHHSPAHIDPIISQTLQEMRSDHGCKRIGAVGYCIGAKYVTRLLKPEEGKIDVGFFAHPTALEAEELAGITGPLSVATAEIDPQFPREDRHRYEEILKGTGQPYMMTLYGGVSHGFAVRGDRKDQKTRAAMDHALRQAVTWFDDFLIWK